jgi:hypothetical protein
VSATTTTKAMSDLYDTVIDTILAVSPSPSPSPKDDGKMNKAPWVAGVSVLSVALAASWAGCAFLFVRQRKMMGRGRSLL